METENRKPTPQLGTPEEAHQKQFTWQILFPILIVAVAALAVGIIAIIAATEKTNMNAQWAMISTIFLLLPWLILSLLPLALIVFAIYLLSRSQKSIKPFLKAAGMYSGRMGKTVEGISMSAVYPVIRFRSAGEGFIHLLKMAFHLDSNPKE